ncbi:pilus assembly protein CpaC [Solimonas aquatica]|uniref:Pilus assembly protein CpaC n=1 Tax=Solimonas aquatica TaxID=489703 RepID=A0A1H9H411_9GAMM|nr:type II and III secretion system protein family protein [Solimonas aquatica]SEQ57081.1 pilus assembly protein CpaC [Solimonas aquatica]
MNKLQTLIRTLLLLIVALSLPASAQQAGNGNPPLIIVEQGTHKLMRANAEVQRVAVGNPATADVSLVNRRDLLLAGKSIGITSLIVWIKGESQPRQYLVRVQLPVDPLKSQKPVDPELSQAIVDPGRGLEGQLPNLLAHRRAAIAASGGQKEAPIADASSVALESQVLTSVKIAEVSRKTLQRYGVNLMVNNGTAGTTSGILGSPGSYSSFDFKDGPGSAGIKGTLSRSLTDAFGLLITDSSSKITALIDLLEGRGLVRTLAEPSLLATSGQTASYLAGGEFPVPVTQGGTSGSGITVQYKEFGVRLSLTPTVLARDRIALKVAPEVSDLDFSAGIQISGVSVPALTVRRTDTSIELGDGETFVISGLISSNLTSNVNKVPWLGDLPVLGAFFKSTTLDRSDKELIMIVTPHLVRPLARDAKLPKLPGDQYSGKTPSFGHNVFLERGDFDSGFSR